MLVHYLYILNVTTSWSHELSVLPTYTDCLTSVGILEPAGFITCTAAIVNLGTV